MIHLALALALAAAPARPPIAPKTAPFAVEVRSPKTDLPELRGFLFEAGAWAPILKPTELGRSLGAMLGADLLDAASLAEAGVDVESPLTVSFLGEADVVCLTAAKGGKAVERARTSLAGAGQAAKQAYKGAQLEGAVANKVWRAGFATKANALCLASGGTDALAALKGAVDALSGAGLAATPAYKAAAGLDAPILGFVQNGDWEGAFEIRCAQGAVKLVGRFAGKAGLVEAAKDGDLISGFAPVAPVVLRATLSPQALTSPTGPAMNALGFLVNNACKDCGPQGAKGLLDAIRPQLTGSVALVVKGLDPTAAIEPIPHYFLVPHAYVLPVKDPDGARKALEAGLEKLKAKGLPLVPVESPDGKQWSISLGKREVRVGVVQGALLIANDSGARDLAAKALAEPRKPKREHAVNLHIEGALATAELRRVSVLDVPKSPDLAALFAFGVEAGALLKAAGPIDGFADPDKSDLRFELGLALPPPAPAPVK